MAARLVRLRRVRRIARSSLHGQLGSQAVQWSQYTVLTTCVLSAATSPTNVRPGLIYVSSYRAPTPANLQAAELDFDNALLYVRGQTNADGKDIGPPAGLTITPGLYIYSAAVTVSRFTFDCRPRSDAELDLQMAAATTFTLNGPPGSIFIISIGGAFSMGANAVISLTGGVTAATVYWYTLGAFTLAASADFSVRLAPLSPSAW